MKPDDARRKVFVIHGRDNTARERLFEFLRALDLKPLEWEMLVASTGIALPFFGDVIQHAITRVQATVVLLTPDDIVHLHPDLNNVRGSSHEISGGCQPRPNVLIELGMALVACPDRTIIVQIGDLRPISDLSGRNLIRFDGSATALGNLSERLKSAGCAVDTQGNDWHNLQRFTNLTAHTRRAPD